MPKPYTPTSSAKLFHDSDRRIKVLWGPIGSGKSSAADWEFILQGLESRVPLRGIVVRSTYRELIDTSKQTFFEWFGDISRWDTRNETAIVKLPHGDPEERAKGKTLEHQLLFRALQRPEDTSKLLSLEIAFAFLEECVPAYATNGVMGQGLAKGVYEIASSRLRQAGAPRYTIVMTANPPAPSHWLYKTFLSAKDEKLVRMNACVVFQPPGENKPNLPKNYYEILRESLDPDMVRRFIDGEIIQAYDGQIVFPEARDHVHIIDKEIKPDPDRALILGFDWGSASATATTITQITATGQWQILRELISPNMGADAHCEELRAMMHEYYPKTEFRVPYRCWGDPSGAHRSQTDAKTCFQIAGSKGFEIQAGKPDWQSRKEVIKQRLQRFDSRGEPALIVSRLNCPVVAEGLLGGYRYPKSVDGRVGHRPIKNQFSHPIDALQYAATMEFEILSPRARGEPEIHIWKPVFDPFRPMVRAQIRPAVTDWMAK